MHFEPDYRNLEMAARNVEVERIPLYEHIISDKVMEKITGQSFAALYMGNDADLDEYFRQYCGFFKEMGYDTVSFEECIGPVMPGSGALGGHIKGVIRNRDDFDRYPWEDIPDMYFRRNARRFEALSRALPPGMKAVGGVGNGIFECAQDLVGYEDLCYMRADDPELYADLFRRIGETSLAIWKRFLKEFGEPFCVCRFGDDLGFKSATLLITADIRELIIPQYKRIISAVHVTGKPFLYHSCGAIFDVMEDLISEAGIDAKHSNEDQIAPFPVWVERYGDRIGNFGGIDTDALCRLNRQDMREYITVVVCRCRGHGGFAFGSGNSIPDYVPVEGFLNMNEIIRGLREQQHQTPHSQGVKAD